jgi:ABC-type oligopeptide transport system substrate-binding subunit
MHRSWSALLGVVGLSLLAGAGHAADRAESPLGGTLRVNVSSADVAHVDPALAYDNVSWGILSATCAKLLNYPDRTGPAAARPQPEVAAAMPLVSRDGRTYTFRLRRTFRFNTGERVTAASFVRAFERALSPRMQSPAAGFSIDIAGAQAFNAGRAGRIAGLRAAGDTLTIRLSTPAPDFLARVAMPFFCAVPRTLPIVQGGVRNPPMAGPYYVAARTPGRSLRLRRNPHYRGPRRSRVAEIHYTVNVNPNASYLQVQRGEVDWDAAGLPPAAHAELTDRYGINRGRYFVHPGMTMAYLALNTSRPLFRDASTRRAVNYALDRRALVRIGGLNAGSPTDQILPPTIPGFRNATIYPLSGDVERAKDLMAGRTGTAILYAADNPNSTSVAALVQGNLKAIGIEVEVKVFSFAVQYALAGRRGEPFDIAVMGWFADYPDPYDFINVLLDGTRIQAENNVNFAYFDDPAYNRKMAAAARLSGPARYRTYGALDIDLSRNAAPLAVIGNGNVREFVSARVGCYSFHPVWGTLNLATVCLRR